MKRLILSILTILALCVSFNTLAYKLVSDPTTQAVTACGYMVDTYAQITIPVVAVTGGKRCEAVIDSLPSGPHTVQVKFINSAVPVTDTAYESTLSLPFTFSTPYVPPTTNTVGAPVNLSIVP